METIPGRAGRTRGRLEGASALLMRKNRTNAQQAHHVPGPRLSSLRRGPYSLLNTPGEAPLLPSFYKRGTQL